MAKIDGEGGFGHPAMRLAESTPLFHSAEDFKIGVAAVVRAGHTGRMGAWVEQAADAGMFGMALLAAKDPPFAPRGIAGSSARSAHEPSQSRRSDDQRCPDSGHGHERRVRELDCAGRRFAGRGSPVGKFADRSGGLSTDPRDYLDGGALLPAGGYKGFGLAVMIEASVLG